MIFIGSDLLTGLAQDDLVLDERGLLVVADEADAGWDGLDALLRAVRSC
jgi:hypothetical protein